MSFAESLKELMIEYNITIKEVAEATEIKLGTIYYYFKHNSIPDVECALKLSEFFKCSINYLLGLDNERKFVLNLTNKSFIEIYEELLKENHVTNFYVCNKLNINRNSIYTWRKGKTPKMVNLILFARFFDVSVDYLLGRTNKK